MRNYHLIDTLKAACQSIPSATNCWEELGKCEKENITPAKPIFRKHRQFEMPEKHPHTRMTVSLLFFIGLFSF